MREPSHITDVLKSGGFAFHCFVGRHLRVGFLAQCCIIAGFAACTVLVGSIVDGSLILNGRDVGLLEHPGIWVFVGLQIALPLSIRHSLNHLLSAQARIDEMTEPNSKFTESVVAPLLKFLRLQDRESRLAATIIYSAGLTAFVWNTYQNQLPRILLPFDFWDSTTYFWGFWITRAYRLYMFGWLIPYVAMIHIGVLVVTLRLVRQARISGRLKLVPFHPDGAGGLGFVPSLVTTPIIVTLLLSSISTAAAFEVHRALDVTPIMGLTAIAVSTGIAYLVPILFLRSDILAMKCETINRLRLLQQTYYSQILESKELDFERLKKGNEALDYFEKVLARIGSISNYPHLKRLLRYIGLALTPSAISLVLKSYEHVAPVIGPWLKKP